MSLNGLLKKIGIYGNNNLLSINGKKWRQIIPYRLHKGLTEINPDVFLVQANKPIALFFDFSKKNDLDQTGLFKKIWNLGGVPIIYVLKSTGVEIYNGFSFDTKKLRLESFKIKSKNITEDNVSFWDILSGNLWSSLSKPKNQVDEKLLENIQDTRAKLIKRGLENICANSIIGRLLFSRYLIDRNVRIDKKYFTDKNSFLNILKNKDKKLLYEYFSYLKDNFDGDLFPVTGIERNSINDSHLDILFSLFNGDQISNRQKSLFDIYDFKIIPVELISEVYERFIGIERQKREGAYYTPSFLVDYILEKTVKLYLKKNKYCKVFDPSCGSGIFLVETLRCIIEKNIKDGNISKKELTNIVKNNIFGVDQDESAINISIFSLYLTLLDYVEPKDISKFKFPTLKDSNLFITDFFDLKHVFNEKIKSINFILGNPPWGSTNNNGSHVEYSSGEKIPISDNQIAQSFIVRPKDFSFKNTECAMVIASKTLYNHNANGFRKYWLNSFLIREILELSPVRNQLFARATAPSTIVFYKYKKNKDTNNNIIIHSSVKPNIFLKYLKIIVIEKNDIKRIKQKYFQQYDWLWKVMLYGNVFDFYFLKKLKENYEQKIENFIQEKQVIFSNGFIIGKKNQKKKTSLSEMKFVEAKDISPYKQNYVFKSIKKSYPSLNFTRVGVLDIYNSPHLLLKRSLKDRPIVTYLETDCAFPNTVFGIHGKNRKLLKALGAYFSSSLVRYFLFLTSSTWGIEREEVLQKEYKILPFPFTDKIKNNLSDIFDNILGIAKYKDNSKKVLDNTNYDMRINKEIKKIDLILLKAFCLSELDKKLVNYNIDISIPLFFRRIEPISACDNNQLRKYAQIFLNYFNINQNKNSGFIELDIYYNRYIVAMNFKSTTKKDDNSIRFIEINQENKNIFFSLIKLGENKVANRLYEQKDIRGMNKDSFYIIKSNQYKNWHSAIAQVDLHEFIEKTMQSGIRN